MESATVRDVLAVPAARGEHVEVELADGVRLGGIACALGTDVVVLDDGHDHHLVRTTTIAVVRPAGGEVGTRRAPGCGGGATCFEDLVHAAAVDRWLVDLWCGSGTVVRGRLRSAGSEVVVIDVEADARASARAVVSLAHLRAISVRPSRAHSSSAPPLSALPTTSG